MAGSLSFPIVLIAYIMEFLMAYIEHYPPQGVTEREDVYIVVVLTAKGPYSLAGRIRLHIGGGVVTIFGKLTLVNT